MARRWSSRLLIATALFLLDALVRQTTFALTCTPLSGCGCELVGKGTIDLSSLGKVGAPAWPDMVPSEPSDVSEYDVDICYGFSDGDACKDTTCCQLHGGNLKYACGYASKSSYFVDISGQVTLTYAGDGQRKQHITLVCDPSATTSTMKATGEKKGEANNYYFTLTSKCACPDGCTGSGGGTIDVSISAGTVLIILFILLLFVYMTAGMLVMRFRMQRTGVDLIPYRTFWTSLPGLIKDGVLFALSPITKRGGYTKT